MTRQLKSLTSLLNSKYFDNWSRFSNKNYLEHLLPCAQQALWSNGQDIWLLIRGLRVRLLPELTNCPFMNFECLANIYQTESMVYHDISSIFIQHKFRLEVTNQWSKIFDTIPADHCVTTGTMFNFRLASSSKTATCLHLRHPFPCTVDHIGWLSWVTDLLTSSGHCFF